MEERFAGTPAVYRNKAKTLAVVSGKGGVGKSNISLNTALALSDKGKKFLSSILMWEWAISTS